MSVLQSLDQSTPLEQVVRALLPDTSNLHLERIVIASEQLILGLISTQAQAACSICGQSSARVQSHYRRTLADLSWASMRVLLHLEVRRFFCSNTSCPRSIFTERLPDLTAPYARRTNRLRDQVLNLAFALGGEAGARQCAKQGIALSPDTLLNLLRRQSRTAAPTPRVLGVDDWSFRRGKPMGTILVDLERHVPIDLLPDCSEEAFAAWLRDRAGIEIISRDRGGAYASGARAGAPEAVQVADRWHILKNLGDAVRKLMGRQGAVLKQAARDSLPCADQEASPANNQSIPVSKCGRRQPKPAKESFQRSWQLGMHQQVRELSAQGNSVAAIAGELNLSRTTVRKYRDMEQFEDLRLKVRRSAVEPYRAYLEQRWAEGCTEIKQLWQELQSQGYQGSYKSVWQFTHKWELPLLLSAPAPLPAPTAPARTPRQAMWLLRRADDTLDDEERSYRDSLCRNSPEIASTRRLVQAFENMMRERRGDQLDGWLAQAQASGVRELRRFALGLSQDYAAVRAAFEYEWSQGQVEGQVNRLKQLKRQMYGRANFDLLRQRVLHRSGP